VGNGSAEATGVRELETAWLTTQSTGYSANATATMSVVWTANDSSGWMRRSFISKRDP
jgi:hypothetical protein